MNRLPIVVAAAAGVAVLASHGIAAASPIVVSDVWSRPALAGGTGVVYASIANNGDRDDRLLSVVSPIAATVEIHTSERLPAGAAAAPGAMPAMGGLLMHPSGPLRVPAHGRLRLAIGRDHVMLMGLRRPLAAGGDIPLVFRFALAGAIRARSTVR